MIEAKFFRSSDTEKLLGFVVSGHAGYAESGQDIVCAAVSSAVMLTANSVTEVFALNAKVREEPDGDIYLKLTEDPDGTGDKLLLGLLTHLYMIDKEFPKTIKIGVIDK
jgi:hypothetical protein